MLFICAMTLCRSTREHLQSSQTTKIAPERRPTESPYVPPHPSQIHPFPEQPRGRAGLLLFITSPGRLCWAFPFPRCCHKPYLRGRRVCSRQTATIIVCGAHPDKRAGAPGCGCCSGARSLLHEAAPGVLVLRRRDLGQKKKKKEKRAAAGKLMAPQPKWCHLHFRAALGGANGVCWRTQLHPGVQGWVPALHWWHGRSQSHPLAEHGGVGARLAPCKGSFTSRGGRRC